MSKAWQVDGSQGKDSLSAKITSGLKDLLGIFDLQKVKGAHIASS